MGIFSQNFQENKDAIESVIFVVGAGSSMAGYRIKMINGTINSFIKDMAKNNGNVMYSVLCYAKEARLLTNGLVRPDENSEIEIVAEGEVDLNSALELLSTKLSEKELFSGEKTYRYPVIIFITDSNPQCDCGAAVKELAKNRWYKNAIKFVFHAGDEPCSRVWNDLVETAGKLSYGDVSSMQSVFDLISHVKRWVKFIDKTELARDEKPESDSDDMRSFCCECRAFPVDYAKRQEEENANRSFFSIMNEDKHKIMGESTDMCELNNYSFESLLSDNYSQSKSECCGQGAKSETNTLKTDCTVSKEKIKEREEHIAQLEAEMKSLVSARLSCETKDSQSKKSAKSKSPTKAHTHGQSQRRAQYDSNAYKRYIIDRQIRMLEKAIEVEKKTVELEKEYYKITKRYSTKEPQSKGNWSVPSPKDEGVSLKRVRFSGIAPKCFVKGEYSMIEIAMYEDSFKHIVEKIKADRGENVQETVASPMSVKDNTKVRVVLSSSDVEVDCDETQEWTGEYLLFSLPVKIPENYGQKQVFFTAKVYFDGVPATNLKFIVKCTTFREQKLKLIREDLLSAFISYAREDRERVATIIQGMRKARPDMDIFFDIESLHSGDEWERVLRKEIDERDVLFLCWSQFAKASKWVDMEWRYALQTKGIDTIEPIPLEPPDECPPPKELSSKHFNDTMLLYK